MEAVYKSRAPSDPSGGYQSQVKKARLLADDIEESPRRLWANKEGMGMMGLSEDPSDYLGDLYKRYRESLLHRIAVGWPNIFISEHEHERVIHELFRSLSARQTLSSAWIHDRSKTHEEILSYLYRMLRQVAVDYLRSEKNVPGVGFEGLQEARQLEQVSEFTGIDTLEVEEIRRVLFEQFWKWMDDPKPAWKDLIVLQKMAVYLPEQLTPIAIVEILSPKECQIFLAGGLLKGKSELQTLMARVKAAQGHVRAKLRKTELGDLIG